jgi:energy-coupling factor transporter ATP-binding protein EcfA2
MEYQSNLDISKPDVLLTRLKDPTEKYIDFFGKLLYPKKMRPLDINSTTIQYNDEGGVIRDFAALSSGEKEVVILTFDLITQSPEDCVILIDEPEVHLHPELTFRLIKVLKSIGERNQYFLFTHSPDIVGNALDTGVHFVRPKSRVPTGSQVIRVDENNLDAFRSIPNIRETIGMISVGKNLLFVEGSSTSIDRNVFATIAKSSKVDVAIIPSDSCTNVSNMTLVCDTLEKGLFGVELFMVRDRDGLVADQLASFATKSKGRLLFLPFYHIENAFLKPNAIAEVAAKVLLAKAPNAQQIEDKLVELARKQLMHTASLYVKSEIYFQAGNFDISPKITIDDTTTIADIASAMNASKSELLTAYSSDFSEAAISGRLTHWHDVLSNAIKDGWSQQARMYFVGKRLLREVQVWLFGSKSILLWEHIVESEKPSCIEACKELRHILEGI